MNTSRRRISAKTINATPFIVPADFSTEYLHAHGIANIVDVCDQDTSLTKRYCYAVQSEMDTMGEIPEYSYQDTTIPVNPYPTFIVKPALRHYLPDIPDAEFYAYETTQGATTHSPLTIHTETTEGYAHGRKYIDFTPHSTHRYVSVSGASAHAIIPMDCLWFFLASCTSIATENYSIKGQNNTSVTVYEDYNTVNYIHLRSGITTLNDRAFYGCKYLKGDLTIPKEVKHVGSECFMNTKMNGTLTIDGVETTGRSAFTQTQNRSLESYYSKLRINASFYPKSAPYAGFDYSLCRVECVEIIPSISNKYYIYNGVLYYQGCSDKICVCCPKHNINTHAFEIEEGTTMILSSHNNIDKSLHFSIPSSVSLIDIRAFSGCPNIYGTLDLSSLSFKSIDYSALDCSHKINLNRKILNIGCNTYRLELSALGIYNEEFRVVEGGVFSSYCGALYKGSEFYALPRNFKLATLTIKDGTLVIRNAAIKNSSIHTLILCDTLTHLNTISLTSNEFNELILPQTLEYIGLSLNMPYLSTITSNSPNFKVDLNNKMLVDAISNRVMLLAPNNLGLFYFQRTWDLSKDRSFNINDNIVPFIYSTPEDASKLSRFRFTAAKCIEFHSRSQYAPAVLYDKLGLVGSTTRQLHIPIDADGHLGDDTGYDRGNSCWMEGAGTANDIFGGGRFYDLVRVHGRITSTKPIPDRFVVLEVGNTIEHEGETVNMYQFTSPIIDNGDGTIDYEVWVKLTKDYTLTFTFDDDTTTVHNINIPTSMKPATGHDIHADITI